MRIEGSRYNMVHGVVKTAFRLAPELTLLVAGRGAGHINVQPVEPLAIRPDIIIAGQILEGTYNRRQEQIGSPIILRNGEQLNAYIQPDVRRRGTENRDFDFPVHTAQGKQKAVQNTLKASDNQSIQSPTSMETKGTPTPKKGIKSHKPSENPTPTVTPPDQSTLPDLSTIDPTLLHVIEALVAGGITLGVIGAFVNTVGFRMFNNYANKANKEDSDSSDSGPFPIVQTNSENEEYVRLPKAQPSEESTRFASPEYHRDLGDRKPHWFLGQQNSAFDPNLAKGDPDTGPSHERDTDKHNN